MNLLAINNRELTMEELHGYSKCLWDILSYLQKETEFNPAKRMIDSVKILESITDTSQGVKDILQRETEKLEKLVKTII